MARRTAHFVLLFSGLAPAVWAVCIAPSDPRRAGVLLALAVLGFIFNGVPLARPNFGIAIPLRVIACGVALAVLAGVLAMWQWIRSAYLPDLPKANVVEREQAAAAARNLLWIAAAVAYVILTILILPVPPPKPRPDKPERIDFRTYGRQEGRR